MEDVCAVKQKPKSLKEFFSSWYFWKPFLALIIGGIAGFVIYYLLSCNAQVCVVSGSTIMTVITGSFFGILITNSPCLKCSVLRK